MKNEKTLATFFAVFNANGSYFGYYQGDTAEKAFEAMAEKVGDNGSIDDWQVVERFVVNYDEHCITVLDNDISAEDEEIEDILEQCGFAGYSFDMSRCDGTSCGDGFVFYFYAPED